MTMHMQAVPWKVVKAGNVTGLWRVEDANGDAICIGLCEADARAIAALPELEAALREVSADMRYLMGRASLEGHEAGQKLAVETAQKLDAALAKMEGK